MPRRSNDQNDPMVRARWQAIDQQNRPAPVSAGPQSGDVIFRDTFPTDGPLTTAETGQAWTQLDDYGSFPQSASGVHSGVLVTKGWTSWADLGAKDIDLTLTLGTVLDTIVVNFRATGTSFGNRLQLTTELPNHYYSFRWEYSGGLSSAIIPSSHVVAASGDVIQIVANGDTVTVTINGTLFYTFDDSTRGDPLASGNANNVAHTGTMFGLGDWDNPVANTLASIVVKVP